MTAAISLAREAMPSIIVLLIDIGASEMTCREVGHLRYHDGNAIDYYLNKLHLGRRDGLRILQISLLSGWWYHPP